MPTIKIDLPEDEFADLKDKATNYAVFPEEFAITALI